MPRAVTYGPRDVRFEERDDPSIIERTDAINRGVAGIPCNRKLFGADHKEHQL